MAENKQGRGIFVPDPEKYKEWMVEPLDYLIMQEMPDEGTNVGLYQVGSTVKNIHEKLGKSNISSGSLSARVRTLKLAGFIRTVRMVGTAGTAAYQKTPRGKEILDEWLKQQR